MIMDPGIRSYLAEIGRKGGRISRRALTADAAREMVRVREARRAYQRFHAMCFWSSPPDLVISTRDIAWICDGLKRHGNRDAWEAAARLCR